MGDARTINFFSLRQGAAFLVLALCLLVLAACSGGGSQPFAKGEGTPGPSGKTVPPIALVNVAGLPQSKLPQLKDALAISAGKRDMAIVDSKLDNTSLSLSGNFQIVADSGAVRVGYNWTLTDPAGTVLHTISAEEVAPGTPAADPWAQVTPAVLQRIAAYTAESLSSRLSQLGYATEVGGLPPPLEAYAKAGPDADKDIDYETLNGPLKPPPTAMAEATPPAGGKGAALAAAEAEPADDQLIAASAEPADASRPAPPDAKGRKQIKAVVVLPVSGAPGNGNADLTEAMRQTLKDAGWPVLGKPRDDALTISGRVKLGPKQGKSQNVALAWTVKTPDGKTLGTIKQTNDVPPGSLEGGWGENALFAAQAAATGIYDLVKKYR